ncbi:hypothetical protein L6164_026692 [Bauhinia variegata]|uniref:Uncharacterized protein n=1 Tax=Bauhinia variegata TaxID=167791 RepID=A0ACB9LR00_BAUVA|nr:hypothetical protein L6164_026692 [Bauhinia variegata]
MASNSSIYAEFFGVSTPHITFDVLPNTDPNIPFHFIVSSAVDSQGDGNFAAGWYPVFDAVTISNYKGRHLKPGSNTESQTKFILSITSPQFKGIDGWTDKATNSIINLINQYNFDGIDICFSSIDRSVTAQNFANRVAELIRRLRQQRKIGIVSISPTPTLDVYYQSLYHNLHAQVDFVNYRFYGLPQIPVDLRTFREAIVRVKDVLYPGAKVLVGNKTNRQSNGKINDLIFFQAYAQVPGLHGIFGWAADESPREFTFERDALKALAQVQIPQPSIYF